MSATPININNLAGVGLNLKTPKSVSNTSGSWFDGFLDKTNTKTGVKEQGWGLPALQGIGGLAQSWLGFKQMSLANKQFNFQKDAFTQQYNQQAQDMNRQLADRQFARHTSNPGFYQSVGEYMGQNEVANYGQPVAQPNYTSLPGGGQPSRPRPNPNAVGLRG